MQKGKPKERKLENVFEKGHHDSLFIRLGNGSHRKTKRGKMTKGPSALKTQ